MGYAISWIAFKDRRAADVLPLLGLQLDGDSGQSDVPEATFNGAQLPTGWYLVFINETAHRLVQPAELGRLSAHATVVAATVEEHVMVVWASEWRNGTQVWSVTRDSEAGPNHLATEGTPPAVFTGIRTGLLAQQAEEDANGREVDYLFDAPLDLAKSLTGYRHDAANDDVMFDTLVPAADTRPRSLLSRLFGRRSS